jgi:hypothetical protein
MPAASTANIPMMPVLLRSPSCFMRIPDQGVRDSGLLNVRPWLEDRAKYEVIGDKVVVI